MTAIRFQHVHKSFARAVAIRDLSFEVPFGQILCLFGPSGCGKSTVLRLIAGLERPDSGTISLEETTVSGNGRFFPPRDRGLGMVFQEQALWPHLRVARQIDLVMRATVRGRPERRRRIESLLADFELEPLKNALPGELSGGERQRVAIARALASNPRILLLDEPFANLDRARADRYLTMIRGLKETRTTILFATHLADEARAMADRVLLMRDLSYRLVPPDELPR